MGIKRYIQVAFRYFKDSFVIFGNWIESLFYRGKDKYKDAWLICERGIEARDNGFMFFKYVCKNHPEINAYYLIDTEQQLDYANVKELGNVIEYKSKEHRMALFYASIAFSTHVGYISPWSYVCHKTFFHWTGCPKFVLLNHGFTKEDMTAILNKRVTGVDLFIAANKRDYDTLIGDKRYMYNSEDVAMTGYARYDRWHDYTSKKQIVLMPTWRSYLVDKSCKNKPIVINSFTNSNYYKAYQSLLNNADLCHLLIDNNITLIFYPHYEMQSAMSLWSTSCKNIVFAEKQHYDIPQLLRDSSAMITDYSGVGFDFAYMYKPLIYFQFDQNEYYSGHYIRSEKYSIEEEGLGMVVTSEDELIQQITQIIKRNFMIEDIYKKRIDEFFTFHDNKNSERIFNAVIKKYYS